MTTLASLIILCILGLGSLLAVSLVNRRQTNAKRARQRVKMLKFRVDALEELAILLDRIVDSRLIVHYVYHEALQLLDTMQQLDPSATYLKASIAHARRRATEFADQYGQRTINRAMESDAKIARAKQALNEGGRILRQRQTRGQLNDTDLEIFLNDLAWNNLNVEIISMIGRGLVAMKREDTMGAFAFYKKAQSILLQSERRDEKRARLIKELNEMMGKNRLLPSPDLMPEAALIFKAKTESSFASGGKTIVSSAATDSTIDLGINLNEGSNEQPDQPRSY
jgi:hypothetical protein